MERALSSNYYLTSSALAQGVQEYQYSVGFRREAVGITSWDYRKPVALARHRVGISDNVTVGGRLELASDLANTGPSLNLRLPLGEIEAATAVSRRLGQWGAASHVGFMFTNRRFGAGGAVMVASREYTTLTPNPVGEDPATEANAFASAAVGDRVSVTLQQSLTTLHQGLSRNRSGVLSTVHLGRNVDLTASVAAFRDERGRGQEAYVGVIPLAYTVSEVGKTLALPYRGGAIALFNVHRVQRVTGRITVVEGAESRIPSYGDFTVTVNGGETTSPIGSSGAFYFEDLPAGTHSAVVRDANGRECDFTVTVPASDAGVVNIGTLRCEARRR